MKKKYILYDAVFFFALFIIMAIYNMRFTDGLDMYTHCEWAHELYVFWGQILSGNFGAVQPGAAYPGWHLFFMLYYSIFQSDAIALGLTNSTFFTVTAIILIYGFRYFFPEGTKPYKYYVYTLIMTFVGPLYCSSINNKYYLGQIDASIWHNPSVIAVKPFCIAAAFLLLKFLDKSIDDKNRKRSLILLSVTMAVSCFFKPSFAQMFIPGLVIFCLVEVLLTKGNFFKQAFALALACIPTGIIMIFQYVIVYQGVMGQVLATDEGTVESGIGFEPFLVWKAFTPCIAGSFFLSYFMPILLFLILIKYIKNDEMMKSGLALSIAGLLPFMLLYNKVGAYNGDFSWGTSLSIFILFTFCCILLEKYRNRLNKYLYMILFTVLMLHTVCGIIYWVELYVYCDFYIGLFPFL